MTAYTAPPQSKVIWLTGLSGAGKSTIAQGLERALKSQNIPVSVLDGDVLRASLNKDLGFIKEDRIENIRRAAVMAKSLVDSGSIVIVALISPYAEGRLKARELFQEGEFLEVFINTPLEVCIQRDPKGLYTKALKGEVKNFTGIDAPYEAPLNPELSLDTQKYSVSELIEFITRRLKLIAN
ncbi:adenylyl-sulfate kinase [Polynucleobacter sphagniphilus]|jgi:adenylyl-sulfate kinase|uniref:adenylyl-sulfate kinase n=1 Tax=Polynucleobacter sphagniphilus TaxID=1743169 RepID=UPI002476C9AB|nr:adenylyl-sulfate kinase [Polynucleobacter sphagniphilus]MDH6301069.1 adenylylsulfate kinase [Polynucleobacter sphagniphilus]